MIKWGYGLVGVALSTFIVYTIGKMFLIGYLWIKMKIKPSEYIPVRVYLSIHLTDWNCFCAH